MTPAAPPGPCLLVVDDSNTSRRLTIDLLAKRLPGAHFVEAADGVSAVASFRDCPAQVVVMDYNMPGIHGVEAAMRIRSIDPGVTVLLTANAQAAVQARAEAAGLHLLCKPITGALADRIAAFAKTTV